MPGQRISAPLSPRRSGDRSLAGAAAPAGQHSQEDAGQGFQQGPVPAASHTPAYQAKGRTAPSAGAADQRLKDCAEALESFAEKVYVARERP